MLTGLADPTTALPAPTSALPDCTYAQLADNSLVIFGSFCLRAVHKWGVGEKGEEGEKV